MQSSATTTTTSSSAIALKALAALAARDFDTLRALLSPNVRLDWPYHHSSAPVVITGASPFIEAMRVIEVFQHLNIEVSDVVEQADTGRSIIEARSLGTYANDRPSYENHYVFMITVEDGKVSEWREFYNPLAVKKAAAPRNKPSEPRVDAC